MLHTYVVMKFFLFCFVFIATQLLHFDKAKILISRWMFSYDLKLHMKKKTRS